MAISLDNLEIMKEIDRSNMLGVVEDFPQQCREAIEMAANTSLASLDAWPDSIIVLGMGGSGIGGDVLESLLLNELTVPLCVNKGYDIPNFVNEKTLVFAVSYSGNTEETLNGFNQVLAKGAKVAVVTSGGQLEEKAQRYGLSIIKLPTGHQPRAAIGYLFFPLLIILQRLNLIKSQTNQIKETLKVLDELSRNLSPETSLAQNQAKQIAQHLQGKIPVIYGFDNLTSVAALRWKCQFNENSKVPAFWHAFPELNHNEIVGWGLLKDISKNFVLILLRDESEHPQMRKRINITRELIEDQVGDLYEVWAAGDSKLAKIFSAIYLGDFVSVYLAIINNVDPTPVERIELLKERLKME